MKQATDNTSPAASAWPDARTSRVRRQALAGLLLAACGFSNAAEPVPQPAGYPGTGRVSLVVPFAPGGTTDLVARLVAQSLASRWASPVIVENRAGAGGNIAAEYVSRARPDGLTLLVAATSFANAPALTRSLRYDIATDFSPVSMVATTPLVLMVSNKSGIRTMAELAERLKNSPGELNYGSSGVGTSIHLSTLMLLNRMNAKATHVVYKGSGPALTALASGEIDILFDNYATAMPFVTGGQVRGLALSGLDRTNLKTRLPTLAEAGFPKFESLTWIGLLAPAKTPAPVVAWLNAEIGTVLAEPATIARLEEMGFSTRQGTPEAMRELVASELTKARRLVQDNGIPVE